MNTSAVYLHSARADFAETQQLPEDVYLGRAVARNRLRFFLSCCGDAALTRIPRAPWMRILFRFHLYQCGQCGTRILRPRMKKRIAYGAVYLPPSPRRLPDAAHRCTARVFSAVCEKVLGLSR